VDANRCFGYQKVDEHGVGMIGVQGVSLIVVIRDRHAGQGGSERGRWDAHRDRDDSGRADGRVAEATSLRDKQARGVA